MARVVKVKKGGKKDLTNVRTRSRQSVLKIMNYKSNVIMRYKVIFEQPLNGRLLS